MNELFIPEEFLIIGTAIKLQKNTVTVEEIKEYMNRCTFNIEYNDSPYKFCVYNENDKTYKVNYKLKIHPYILNILTSI